MSSLSFSNADRPPFLLRAILALFFSAGALFGDSTVVFNETMYHPGGDEETLEWVELYNQMAVDMDLSEWRLAGGVEFRFEEGTIIPGGGFLVIAKSPDTIKQATGLEEVLGPFTGRLENAGERLELRNNNDRLMDAVSYDDLGRWPVEADGSGASLAKIDPDSASSPSGNWTWSLTVGGTPGAHNFPAGEDPEDPKAELALYYSFDDASLASGSYYEAGAFVSFLDFSLIQDSRSSRFPSSRLTSLRRSPS